MANYYYKVWVASGRYHSSDPLTYCASQKLIVGSIVSVSLKQWQCLAIVQQEVAQPHFKVKSIDWSLDSLSIPKPLLQLREWMQQYYPGSSGVTTQLFLPSGSLKPPLDLSQHQYKESKINKNKLPTLSSEQVLVLKAIKDMGTYVIHGETGTGKTRVYQELAMRAINNRRSAIILTPEISLTAQLYKNFRAVFGERVVIVHSQLTPATRRQTWLRIATTTEPLIIIGTRSALFSPLKDIGLIVVDEAHEPAYKQDKSPYYHAIRVASKLSSLHQAALVLGSATPPVLDYFIAQHKKIPILRLELPAIKKLGRKIEPVVLDLKDRSHFTKAAHLSDELLSAMEQALERKEQTLLFLNRRGTAHVVLCQNCGWQALCPHCDTPLTYHGDVHAMRCHSCNYSRPSVVSCPVCKSADIVFRSVGTKAIADEVHRLFPDATIMRFDTDNKKVERFEENYEQIVQGKVDIIIGTQTLAKGLDLPNLSVVGVITADTSLYIPDFMAQERTYQLVSQVIGRTSRGKQYGKVIIQTYTPTSSVLRAALQKDWLTFYSEEIQERQEFMFPPFCYLLKLSCRRRSPSAAQQASRSLIKILQSLALKIDVNGPAPSFHEKHGNQFEWQLIIKAKKRSELLKAIAVLPSGWSYDIDPVNLL
ncbi:MAG TPA: primosomal protein N' [Candidatus Saccharimonadales bacterium]|nr:primosomal protein N' [Candidatus Saccharimonadales bacterium]